MTPQEKLRAACDVQEGWDGEPGSALPDTRAKINATAAVALFEAAGLPPEDVDADALGGIALEWSRGKHAVILRCRNGGGCVLSMLDDHEPSERYIDSRMIAPTAFAEAIPEVQLFLAGGNDAHEVKP